MPLYTLINPSDEEAVLPFGTFPPFSVTQGVDLNNPEVRDAIQNHKLVLLDDGADERTLVRALYAIFAQVMPGLDSESAREVYRSKAGQQEWHDLLALLDRND